MVQTVQGGILILGCVSIVFGGIGYLSGHVVKIIGNYGVSRGYHVSSLANTSPLAIAALAALATIISRIFVAFVSDSWSKGLNKPVNWKSFFISLIPAYLVLNYRGGRGLLFRQ